MSQFDPFAISRRSRQACQQRRISATDHLVLETLLYRCRPKLGRRAQVAGKRIAELAGLAYSTIRRSLDALRAAGLLAWERTYIRVAWMLGVAVRRWRNIYTFPSPALAPATESDARSTDSKQESSFFLPVPRKEECSGNARPRDGLEDAPGARVVGPDTDPAKALSAIARQRQEVLLAQWRLPPSRWRAQGLRPRIHPATN